MSDLKEYQVYWKYVEYCDYLDLQQKLEQAEARNRSALKLLEKLQNDALMWEFGFDGDCGIAAHIDGAVDGYIQSLLDSDKGAGYES